jgi:hypothetical protein
MTVLEFMRSYIPLTDDSRILDVRVNSLGCQLYCGDISYKSAIPTQVRTLNIINWMVFDNKILVLVEDDDCATECVNTLRTGGKLK